MKKTLLRPVGDARVTQAFGVVSVTGIIHRGIDYGVGTGTLVRATERGDVSHTEHGQVMPGLEPDGSSGGYGTQVRINHADFGADAFTSIYGHLSDVAVVEGQHVERGEVIGWSGDTGISSAPHLHFQTNDSADIPFDPEPHFGEPEEEDVLPPEFEELWPYLKALAAAAKRGGFTSEEDSTSPTDPESRAVRRLGELIAAAQLSEGQLPSLPPTLEMLVKDLINSGLTDGA